MKGKRARCRVSKRAESARVRAGFCYLDASRLRGRTVDAGGERRLHAADFNWILINSTDTLERALLSRKVYAI